MARGARQGVEGAHDRPPTASVRRRSPPAGSARWRVLRSTRRSRPGTTSSGSGRSEMSSPGKASWCICGPHVTGVDGPHRQRGLLHGQHRAQVVERRLGQAVAAPAFVRLDRRVGGDVDHGGARRPSQDGERLLHQRRARPPRSPRGRASGRRAGTRRGGGAGLVPSVLALLTSRSRPPSPSAASTSAARWAGSVMSPETATTAAPGARPSRTRPSATVRASSPRASRTSAQPSWARASASARPSPRDAPVTIATAMAVPPVPRNGDALLKILLPCFIPRAQGPGQRPRSGLTVKARRPST